MWPSSEPWGTPTGIPCPCHVQSPAKFIGPKPSDKRDMLPNFHYTAISSHLPSPKWYLKGIQPPPPPPPSLFACHAYVSANFTDVVVFSILAWSPECHIHLRVDGAKWGLGSSCFPSERWDWNRKNTERTLDLGKTRIYCWIKCVLIRLEYKVQYSRHKWKDL